MSFEAAFPAMGAIMVALFTDFKTGTLFSRHGKLILDLGGYKYRIAEARVAFSSIIAPSYYQPMQSLIKGLSESYKTGMQVGDTDRYVSSCMLMLCLLSERSFLSFSILLPLQLQCHVVLGAQLLATVHDG